MIPPGLGVRVRLAARAGRSPPSAPGGRYYFDWARTAKEQRKEPPNSPFTPPVTLLQRARRRARHDRGRRGSRTSWSATRCSRRATRAGAPALGLELYGDRGRALDVVTAIDAAGRRRRRQGPEDPARQLGITANGGQAQLEGKIIRIAHCGYFGAFDILTSLAGLEMVLAQLGHAVEHGAGVGAAQKVFLEAGVPAAAPREPTR